MDPAVLRRCDGVGDLDQFAGGGLFHAVACSSSVVRAAIVVRRNSMSTGRLPTASAVSSLPTSCVFVGSRRAAGGSADQWSADPFNIGYFAPGIYILRHIAGGRAKSINICSRCPTDLLRRLTKILLCELCSRWDILKDKMSNISFDPMAAAIDWLDAYRSSDLEVILEMHADDAVVECGCGGMETITGKHGLRAYWKRRLQDYAASDLDDLQPSSDGVKISYVARGGVVAAALQFDADGRIALLRCDH